MRRLTLIVLAVAALYSGYWFVGARTVKAQATSALTDMAAQGWEVNYAALGTRGFPNRFDTTVTDITLAAPDGSLRWSAPFLQVFALSYQPNKIIAAFPDAQQLTLSDQEFNVQSNGLRASAAVGASTALPLRDITIETGALSVEAPGLGSLSLAEGLFAFRSSSASDLDYNSYLSLTGLTPPFDAGSVTAGTLPTAIERVTADILLTTSRPLDRHAGDGPPPLPTDITLRDITLVWGEVQLSLSGEMTVNPSGEPTGSVEVTLKNWETALQAAQNAGLIDDQTAMTYAATARGAAGGGSDLTIPVTLTDGAASMGFIPLGQIDFWE